MWEDPEHAFFDEQGLPLEELFYTRCAEAWNWPPSVTAEQPAYQVEWMLRIRDENQKIESAKAERAGH